MRRANTPRKKSRPPAGDLAASTAIPEDVVLVHAREREAAVSAAASHSPRQELKMSLPISAKDVVVFRPYTYALELAKKSEAKLLTEAQAKLEAAKEALTLAEKRGSKMVADAEAELAKNTEQAVYGVKVPTTRSRAAATRDIDSEAIPRNSNLDLVNAALTGELTDEEQTLLQLLQAQLEAGETPETADWDKAWELAKTIPASARLIANRTYRWEMERFHLIRHHVQIEGQKFPLSEAVANRIPDTDRALLSAKIVELLTPSEDQVKN